MTPARRSIGRSGLLTGIARAKIETMTVGIGIHRVSSEQRERAQAGADRRGAEISREWRHVACRNPNSFGRGTVPRTNRGVRSQGRRNDLSASEKSEIAAKIRGTPDDTSPMSASDRTRVPLRRAVAADALALSDLAIRSKRSNGYDETFMAACRDELTVTTEDLEADEYWIVGGTDMHGFAALRCSDAAGLGEVHAFFVDPDRQRLGVGRRLWDELVARARSRGLTELRLDADPAAVPFYREMGLETIGESPSGSIPGRVLPRMAIRL